MTSTITHEQLSKENAELRQQVMKLTEQLNWFTRQLFGKKSEKIIHNSSNEIQLELDFGIVATHPAEKEPIQPEPRARRKPIRDGKDAISFPDNLPVVTTVIDIPDNEKICPETGKPLIKIGEEITQKLASTPATYFIKQIIRIKYAFPQESTGGVVVPALPDSLLTRCQADESLLADILVKKFADHLPIYRISEILGRQGINISRQIISKWVIRCGLALKPLYDKMTEIILAGNNIFIDETPIDMLDPGKGRAHQAYMWIIVGGKDSSDPPFRIYNFRTNRQHKNATEILRNYSGIVHSDKYGAYENLANNNQFTWCPCWAHIRRKFLEESGDPEFRTWVLRKIKYLFMLERVAWARSPEERLLIRQTKEIPIIEELIAKIKDRLFYGTALPKSKFKEALGYFCGLIPRLKNYTLNPWSRIDNNVAERAVRPLALGRKNWLFVGSEEGGQAAAVILSLVQTCRALKVNPTEYLEDVMRRIMSHNSQKLEELLPGNWVKSEK